MRIKWCKLQPLLQILKSGFIAGVPGKLFQQRDMATPESPSLRDKPAVEKRVAVDLDALQKISADQPGQHSLPPGRKCSDPLFCRAGNFQCVDEAIGKVQSDRICIRVDTLFAGFIDYSSKFAERPPEFSARIVRDIPQ